MAPNVTTALTTLCEEDLAKSPPSKPVYKRKIVWFNVYAFCVLHATALYGIYLAFTSAKLITTFYGNYTFLYIEFNFVVDFYILI